MLICDVLAKADGFFAIDNFKADRWVVSFLKIERTAMCKEENTTPEQRKIVDDFWKWEKLSCEANRLVNAINEVKMSHMDDFSCDGQEAWNRAYLLECKAIGRARRRVSKMYECRSI